MRILVLGGTQFVGRHFVEAALQRGHAVTLFHRGKRGAELFPGADRIIGDRDGGLDSITDKGYDAIVDTSGYLPRVVRQSVEAFKGSVPKYLFISTISVYRDNAIANQDENSALIELEDPTVEDIGTYYGGLKVLCEREVLDGYPDAFIIRPGLIAGPYDPTNRFTYWVDRIDRGGEVLVPNRSDQPLQLIDGRDLANFMILGLEKGLKGVYNATGEPSTFGDMIDTVHQLRLDAQLVWVSEAFLQMADITLWQELPLVVPKDDNSDGLMQVDSSKARQAGLENRPLEQTARDTLAWRRTLPADTAYSHGLGADKEMKALETLSGGV